MPFKDNIIDKAILNCLHHWELPPTLPQFVECCKAYSKQGAYTKYSIASKPATPEVAKAHIQQIKTHLNMPLRGTGESKCKY